MQPAIKPAQQSTTRSLVYVGFSLVALLMVALQVYHFSGRDYRTDEAWFIHATTERSLPEVVRWITSDIHPPGWLATADLWIDLFGHQEPITRFMSKLYALLALALTFRLAADLYNRQIGLLATFMLGTMPFMLYYLYEFRPYALLVLGVVGLHLALLRWLRRQNFLYALLTVFFGGLVIYTHFFGFFELLGMTLFLLLAVRFEPGLWLRATGLALAVALLFMGWVLPFLHTGILLRPSGIEYNFPSDDQIFPRLYRLMYLNPRGVDLLLLVVGLLTVFTAPSKFPVWRTRDGKPIFRFDPGWRALLLVVTPLLVLVIAVAVNRSFGVLNQRNLIIVLPPLVIFAAYALWTLPSTLRVIIIGLMLVYAPLTRVEYEPPRNPYNAIFDYVAARFQPGDALVFDFPLYWEHVATKYYLQERLPGDLQDEDLFHIFYQPNNYEMITLPVLPVNRAEAVTIGTINQFAEYIESADQVWYFTWIDGIPNPGNFRNLVSSNHVPVAADQFSRIIITRYLRPPADLSASINFGDLFVLQGVEIAPQTTIAACESLELTSWWQPGRNPGEPYNIALGLLSADDTFVSEQREQLSEISTDNWRVNRLYVDETRLTVPCDTAPGTYRLVLSIFGPGDEGSIVPPRDSDGNPLQQPGIVITPLQVRAQE